MGTNPATAAAGRVAQGQCTLVARVCSPLRSNSCQMEATMTRDVLALENQVCFALGMDLDELVALRTTLHRVIVAAS